MHSLSRLTLAAALLTLAGCESAEEVAQRERLAEGQTLYEQNCRVCHAAGINGAPIVGNAKMWGPRAKQGVDVLVQHAIEGYGLMPAKGGKTHLSDAQIRLVVEFYLAQLPNE
ncbi:c-type cytochrome [Atopomonas hussainii]|uniref:c-type cytochrome n=1 Tax=Atopomonas hussainii TaxID=1429083 RepID=UPI00090008B5|nr:c-type cytochrome [Atopomonas hussainii]